MKNWVGLLTPLAGSTAVLAVEYKADWDAYLFYDEVTVCRSALLIPAAKSYLDRGAAAKISEEELRNKVISILPALEHPGFAFCYCAVNEVAKARDYPSYYGDGNTTARLTLLKAQLDTQPCSDKFKAAMAELENKEVREAIVLK